MGLSNEHKKFLLIQQGLFPIIINIGLNGIISWFVFKKYEKVTFWGESGIIVDILTIGFLLPFITCVFGSLGIYKKTLSCKLSPLNQVSSRGGRLYQFHLTIVGLILGLISLVLATTPFLIIIKYFDLVPMDTIDFVRLKAAWSGMLAGIFTPLIAYLAMKKISQRYVAFY